MVVEMVVYESETSQKRILSGTETWAAATFEAAHFISQGWAGMGNAAVAFDKGVTERHACKVACQLIMDHHGYGSWLLTHKVASSSLVGYSMSITVCLNLAGPSRTHFNVYINTDSLISFTVHKWRDNGVVQALYY